MKKTMKQIRVFLAALFIFAALPAVCAQATEDDNSLSSLGILTEGATVTPEFGYGTTVYEVTVPTGTKALELDPLPTSSSATISDISGNEIGEDGTATIYITVRAGNGDEFPYQLNVVSEGPAIAPETETEPPTEPETETESETETEDSQFVRVYRDTVSNAQNTITTLKEEIIQYKDRINLLTKIIYGLIALCVVLLFIVINLLLKRRELKEELKDYRSYGYSDSKSAQKARRKAEKKQQKGGNAPAQGVPYGGQQQYGAPQGQASPQVPPTLRNDPYGARPAGPGPEIPPQPAQQRPQQQMPRYDQQARQTPQAQEPQGVIRATMTGSGRADERAPETPAPQPQAPQQQAQAEQPQSQPQAGQPQEQAPAQKASKKSGRGGKGPGSGNAGGVEIDMIDL